MSLPLELREILYDTLWRLEPIRRIQYNGYMVRLHYDDFGTEESPCRRGLPRWLLVNKAFLLEGMIQLDMMTMWAFEPAPNGPAITARPNTQFLDLSRARRLTVRTRDPMVPHMFQFHIPIRDRTHIEPILKTGLRLAVFRFRGVIRGWRILRDLHLWNLTLEWLERLQPRPRVDRFEYEISGVEKLFELNSQAANSFLAGGPAWLRMQGAFEKEVERVGKLLVDCDGTLETTLSQRGFVQFGVSRTEVTCKLAYTRIEK